MSVLGVFIIIYVVISVSMGLFAARKVNNSTDFILAGRSLPIYITIATVFATWFGSEAVLGIPATFMEEGMAGIVADPFGAGLCLVFVGLFFARRLYRMKLLTIGDFYRKRFSRQVEVLVSIAICISYLGWVAAQIVALGLTINLISYEAISFEWAMVIGLAVVLIYTIYGGMWSVAVMDFIQMMAILAGLLVVAYLVANRLDGGVMTVVNHASAHDKFNFWPDLNWVSVLTFVGAFVTLALGSIPQQDVFQRVMSADNESIAVKGTVLGGVFYMLFCFVPIFIVYGASMLSPELASAHLAEGGDSQRILPEYILQQVPMWVQVMFFGALVSAIMSTASGTLLAPSAIFAKNILRQWLNLNDSQLLVALRLSVLVFGLLVLLYAYLSSAVGLSIFEMVENAYLVTLCGAFVPLAFGVYWKKANNTGALLSIALGVLSWSSFEVISLQMTAQGSELLVPPQLIGLGMAIIGMVVGSKISSFKNESITLK